LRPNFQVWELNHAKIFGFVGELQQENLEFVVVLHIGEQEVVFDLLAKQPLRIVDLSYICFLNVGLLRTLNNNIPVFLLCRKQIEKLWVVNGLASINQVHIAAIRKVLVLGSFNLLFALPEFFVVFFFELFNCFLR
jgi:hypothetical protein